MKIFFVCGGEVSPHVAICPAGKYAPPPSVQPSLFFWLFFALFTRGVWKYRGNSERAALRGRIELGRDLKILDENSAFGFLSVGHFTLAGEFSLRGVDLPWALFKVGVEASLCHEDTGLVIEFDLSVDGVVEIVFFASQVSVDVELLPESVSQVVDHLSGGIDRTVWVIGSPCAIEFVVDIDGGGFEPSEGVELEPRAFAPVKSDAVIRRIGACFVFDAFGFGRTCEGIGFLKRLPFRGGRGTSGEPEGQQGREREDGGETTAWGRQGGAGQRGLKTPHGMKEKPE